MRHGAVRFFHFRDELTRSPVFASSRDAALGNIRENLPVSHGR
jgi:hypothetical protein